MPCRGSVRAARQRCARWPRFTMLTVTGWLLQESPNHQSSAVGLKMDDFVRDPTTVELRARDLDLSKAELDMYLDLGPYCNPSFYVTHEGASLSKAYSQFRELGLRHLIVIPNPGQVTGIITRKDLLPEMLSRRFPEISSSRSPGARISFSRSSSISSLGSFRRVVGNLNLDLGRIGLGSVKPRKGNPGSDKL